MIRKPLTISLVIPVYNEEDHLAECLQAALSQYLPFTEIIVVDNNSSDTTMQGIARFGEVRRLRENRQGVVFARNRGFDAATGDIIARIDADTILPPNWSQQVADIFADSTVAAVSGAVTYNDIAACGVVNSVDFALRAWLASKLTARMFLLGANMAIRKDSWQAVRDALCDSGVHEDLDLATHLAERRARVLFVPALVAGVSGRRADTSPLAFMRYVLSLPHSYASHGGREHRYMYPVIAVVLASYLPLRILFRGYDKQESLFRISQFFTLREPQRVNPVSFIE